MESSPNHYMSKSLTQKATSKERKKNYTKSHLNHSKRPTARPISVTALALLSEKRAMAPLGVPDADADGEGEVLLVPLVLPVVVLFEAVALAAAWNASKVFAAVGLTAKTMPFAQ